ncbi:MAG: exopolyphosphatase [Bacteroidetes bacterium]|nr:exopolyphosphatase [Bacteroidota bacterium]
MLIRKFAGIDIGSNAMRLLIMNVYKDENKWFFNKSALVRAPVRLGKDSFANQIITEETLDLMTHAMKSYYHLMQTYQVVSYKACGTSALREAANRDYIVEEIFKRTGLKIDIIDGKEEADIIYKTQIDRIVESNKSYLFVDVGGGSTELTYYHDKKVIQAKSFKIGSVRLLNNLVEKSEWESLKEWCKKNFINKKDLILVGSGGNINTLFKKSKQELGTSLKYKYIQEFKEELAAMTMDERIRKYEFNTDRADVIVPALSIYEKIMKYMDGKEIFVPKIGLADGLVQMALEEYLLNEKNRSSTIRI